MSASKGTALAQLAVSEISASRVITEESLYIINIYTDYKRYGAQFLFPDGVDQVPNYTKHLLDICIGKFDELERKQLDNNIT
mgnify:FL=1